MTRYQLENALCKIEGYHMPHHREPIESSFARAKAELITHLKQDLADVESVTAQQFSEAKRSNFRLACKQ